MSDEKRDAFNYQIYMRKCREKRQEKRKKVAESDQTNTEPCMLVCLVNQKDKKLEKISIGEIQYKTVLAEKPKTFCH